MKNNDTLRKSIIKALVTGKGTTHHLSDSSAFDLAESIRSEQRFLLKNKVIKKLKNDNSLFFDSNKYKLIENGLEVEIDEETKNNLRTKIKDDYKK